MNTALKIGGYTLGLLAVFGAAVGIGAAVTPTATSAATSVADTRRPRRHVRDDHGARRRCGVVAGRADGVPGRLHPSPGRPVRCRPGRRCRCGSRSWAPTVRR